MRFDPGVHVGAAPLFCLGPSRSAKRCDYADIATGQGATGKSLSAPVRIIAGSA